MEVLFLMALSLLCTFGVFFAARIRYKRKSQLTLHKFSDAEIFKLMAKANHFLTHRQLASVSPLSEQEAKERLMYLSLEKIIRKYGDGGYNSVYQLREEIPEHNSLPISIQGLTDDQIIASVIEYTGDYQITIAELVVVFGIDIYEARKILERLKKNGLVNMYRRGVLKIYVVKSPLQQSSPNLKMPDLKSEKIRLNFVEIQAKIKIPDAKVLNIAVEQKGRLTPELLCLKLNISLYEAKIKLEELYDQGVFIMDVNEENSMMEYQLRDKNLLK